ncbi:hypothetical protein Tco_1222685 [Tanacetum coccineum]
MLFSVVIRITFFYLPSWKRYRGTSELVEDSEEEDDEEIDESMDSDSLSEDAKDEGPTAEDEDPAAKDEGLTVRVEGPSMDDESYGLDSESHGIDNESRAPVVRIAVSAPLGLRYGALRPQELALEEDDVYNTFEVGQSFGSAPESERPERTFGLLPISPSPSNVPSAISSPMIPLTVPSLVATHATAETEGFLTELGAQVEMQEGLIRDHIVRLEELSPALFERYNRDIGELFTRSGAIREEIFSQRYRFRSLEYEQERVVVTFGAIWRPVLALKSWTSQTDAQRAALWHAISDVQGENQDLRLQLAEERRARLELVEVVDDMRRGQEPKGDA